MKDLLKKLVEKLCYKLLNLVSDHSIPKQGVNYESIIDSVNEQSDRDREYFFTLLCKRVSEEDLSKIVIISQLKHYRPLL